MRLDKITFEIPLVRLEKLPMYVWAFLFKYFFWLWEEVAEEEHAYYILLLLETFKCELVTLQETSLNRKIDKTGSGGCMSFGT